MKNLKATLCLLIVAACLLPSCNNYSIEIAKRKYRPGYYVSVSQNKKLTANPAKIAAIPAIPAKQLVASENKQPVNLKKNGSDTKAKTNEKPVAANKITGKVLKSVRTKSGPPKGLETVSLTKKDISLSKKKLEQKELFYLMGGLAALGCGGLYYSERRRLRKISKWSRENPILSRTIQGIGHAALGFGSFIGGSLLYSNGITTNSSTLDVFSVAFLVACAAYPLKKSAQNIFKPRYHRHKINDMAIILSSLMMCTTAGNLVANERATASTQHIISNKPAQRFFDNVSAKSTEFVTGIFKNYEAKDKKISDGVKFLLLFFTILIALALTVCIAALSCQLSCEGNEGLAVFVLVGGLLLLAGLTVAAIRGIVSLNDDKAVAKP